MRVMGVAIVIVVVFASGAFAQNAGRPSASSVGTKTYTPARTPWGDPDLQGTFANSNEYATPLERPARFAGRTLDSITDKQIHDLVAYLVTLK